jgi:fatty acid desaturase
MTGEARAGVADRIKRIPNPGEPVRALAWPTALLFLGGVGLWLASSAAYLGDVWPWPVSTFLNWVAAFMLFTVMHDASHRSVSKNEHVSTWLGRVSAFFLVPNAGFRLFRFVHMQHHRFTQQDDASDPDYYSSHAPRWQLPLRWATQDLGYFRFYLPKWRSRPRGEKAELLVTLALFVAVSAAAFAAGYAFEWLVLWILPSRLAILSLGFAFDWLPHHDLAPPGKPPDQFKATRNRVGLEWLMSPAMLYQNYHLVHHLHPLIPFYRYIAVWRRNEEAYLEREPPLTTVLGRPLTVDEYRKLRELERH